MTQAPRPAQIKPAFRDFLGSPIDFPTIEICDVGAMSEGRDRYAALLEQGLANVNGFEPNPDQLAKLRSLNKPRSRYFPNFLGAGGPATFYIAQYPGCSSLYEPDPSVIDLFTTIGATLPGGNFAVTRTEQVLTTRLDDVADLPPPDYLKLDIQGGELDVLRSATRSLQHVAVIELEVEFVPIYKNQPLFGEIQTFLAGQNFMLHKMIDVGGRSFRPYQMNPNPFLPMSQLLWADAIFVRNFARLDVYSDDQLLKAAIVLYEVYSSYDLVRFLLAEFDRRRGTDLAVRFHERLARTPNLPLTFMSIKQHP